MKKLLRNLIFLIFIPFSAFGAGNETINVLPDSNKATFRVDSQNFWKNELPNILHRYIKEDFVYSGGIHGVSSGCVSDPFSVEAFTTKGNRVTADGAGGAASINYGASNIGGTCANDVCWVVASPQEVPTLPGTNFQRAGGSHLYVDCASSSISSWPDDSARLMKVTLSGGAISAVDDLHKTSALVSNIICDGATDATIAIQKALDESPLGSTIVLPPGVCLLSQTININRPLGLEGAGMERTFLRQTVSNIPVINVSSYTVNINRLTVNHSGNAVEGGDGIIVRGPGGVAIFAVTIMEVGANYNFRGFVFGAVSYSQAAHLWAMRNNSHGFEFLYEAAGGGVLQWDIFDVLSQQNLGAGYFGHNVAAANGIGPWLTQGGSFANNGGGSVFHGSPGFPISALRFSNLGASTDNIVGLYLNTFGGSHTIVMPSVENVGLNAGIPIGSAGELSVASNSGHGIEITVNNNYGVMINGGTFWNNSWSGVLLGAPFSQLIGGQTVGNGKAFATEPHKRAGVYISADNVQVSNHTFQFVGDGSTLEYIGIYPLVTGTIIGPNIFAPGLPPVPMRGPGGGESTASIICDGATFVSAQIQALIDTVPLGSRILLPPGICQLNQTLVISRAVTLEGAGQEKTILRQAVPNIGVVIISAANVNLRGLTVTHSETPVLGGDGVRVPGLDGNPLFGVVLEDVYAKSNWRGFVLGCVAYSRAIRVDASLNNSHGFEFVYELMPNSVDNCGSVQWDIINAASQLNIGAGFGGFNNIATNGIGPWISQSISFGNNSGGYVFIGSPGHPINDIRLHSNLSSADNVAGIYMDTYGASHIISDPWIELTGHLAGFPIGTPQVISEPSHSGHCLGVTSNNQAGMIITGGLYWSCSWSGVALFAPYATLSGGASRSNGQAMSTNAALRAGVAIGANGVAVNGHSFTYPSGVTANYIHLSESISDLAIGVNTYSPDLPPQNWLRNDASIIAPPMSSMVTGLRIYSNTPESPGLMFVDKLSGPNPNKFMRVANGSLDTLNTNASTVIQSLSDAGTPSWPNRRGIALIVDNNTTANVALEPNEPDTNYFVQLTVSGSNGSTPQGLVVAGVNKFAFGFEIVVTGAPGVGKSVVFDWLVHR